MPEQRDSGGMSTAALWWPMIGASVFLAAFSIPPSVVRTVQVYPQDPWESIVIADAYRASVGLPVYTDPQIDHATHIYGPLLTYTIGLIFKLTGVNFIAGHLVPLVAIIWIIAALAAIYFRRLPWVFAIAGVAVLMSFNLRTNTFFSQIKADMPALGISLLALILIFQAMEKGRWACYPLALVSFCGAYLFKQTAAMFTIVPLLSLLLRQRGSIRAWLAVAGPPAAIAALIFAIWVFAPNVHYHMITAVSRWPIQFGRLAVSPLRFVSFSPLPLVALCMMILIRPGISLSDPKLRWLVAACVGSLPGSFLAWSKLGGGLNSFLPALLPLNVISIVGIAAAWETICANPISRVRAHAFAWLMALVMMVGGVVTSQGELQALFFDGHGDGHYPQVVERVRQLKGRVICPDDPTIPILALGQTGRSSWAEYDTMASQSVPDYFSTEVMGADYVVVVNSYALIVMTPEFLRALNFEPAGWGGADMGMYALWRKSPAGRGDNRSRLD